MTLIKILSGGAAQNLIRQLEPRLQETLQVSLDCHFGAVGTMRDLLLSGTPADLVLLTESIIDELIANGRAMAGTKRVLGAVETCVAIKRGQTNLNGLNANTIDGIVPKKDLVASLLKAPTIYVPDVDKSTAGKHVLRVLEQLGLADSCRGKLKEYPSGTFAMKDLAYSESSLIGSIGITQATEILGERGVELVGKLPEGLGLSTVYVGAVCSESVEKEIALKVLEMISGSESRDVRQSCGFESV